MQGVQDTRSIHLSRPSTSSLPSRTAGLTLAWTESVWCDVMKAATRKLQGAANNSDTAAVKQAARRTQAEKLGFYKHA